MTGRKQFYEVKLYETIDRFDQGRPNSIVGGMDALSASWFAMNETNNYAVVKVQSEDCEEIWIIKAHD